MNTPEHLAELLPVDIPIQIISQIWAMTLYHNYDAILRKYGYEYDLPDDIRDEEDPFLQPLPNDLRIFMKYFSQAESPPDNHYRSPGFMLGDLATYFDEGNNLNIENCMAIWSEYVWNNEMNTVKIVYVNIDSTSLNYGKIYMIESNNTLGVGKIMRVVMGETYRVTRSQIEVAGNFMDFMNVWLPNN